MTRTSISILGAGPAGFALAADLHTRGFPVLLYSHPAHTRHLDAVRAAGQLRVHGIMGDFTMRPAPAMTTSIEDVIRFSRILVFTVPSTGQTTLWEELREWDLSGHVVVAVPGNLWALVVEADGEERRSNGRPPRVIFETNLSPYSCRMREEGELVIMGKKSSFVIAAHPAASTAMAQVELDKRVLEAVLPIELHWRANVLEVSLNNINGVFHPLMVLMNVGWIESTSGDFYYYADGLSDSVANAILAVDRVRLEVGKALGFSLKGVLETSNEMYGHTFTSLTQLATDSKPHRKLKAPANLEGRSISEDVADLLVPWMDIAKLLSLDARPLQSVVDLAGMALGADYSESGRNLRKLGLEGWDRHELVRKFTVGERRTDSGIWSKTLV